MPGERRETASSGDRQRVVGVECRLRAGFGLYCRSQVGIQPRGYAWIPEQQALPVGIILINEQTGKAGSPPGCGIGSLEDKIVQQAVAAILNAVYEVDFKGFSYGFRPGRSPRQALDALNVGICRKRVNRILDANGRCRPSAFGI